MLLLSWPQPSQASFSTLRGAFRHRRGEFFASGTDADGNPVHTRYSFADIGADTFRWDQAFSADGERWRTNWIMEYSRRDPLRDAPIFVEPATGTERCPGPEYRAYDFLLGNWSAAAELAVGGEPAQGHAATLRAVPILGGCAVLDFWETVDATPAFKAFGLRVYSAAEERWLAYHFDTAERVFRRFEAESGAADGVLMARDGEHLERITWSATGTDAPAWRHEVSQNGGAAWRLRAAVQLSR